MGVVTLRAGPPRTSFATSTITAARACLKVPPLWEQGARIHSRAPFYPPPLSLLLASFLVVLKLIYPCINHMYLHPGRPTRHRAQQGDAGSQPHGCCTRATPGRKSIEQYWSYCPPVYD
ncbi:hypothetical protein ElyMa_006085300 [Elysia marginata]|uniref:Uncharacterized protein n=1 Tax=Elysia marginata TaxID=1093978 RepID=A0AAV4GPU5_9GAST|nr:hypothetical protein ElyMa_006085300 [Elysia marginata]